ncbi:hypothetical protein, partial [Paenibacillus thiaminolyticus]|uniref:hypothetical protein n=1 Tax=Paenibacillus thiaminolyticus TaxID=49283 RepID=UPI002282C076
RNQGVSWFFSLMNNIPMTQEVEMNESLSAPLKSIIPLEQEAGCIMGFSSLMNNIPITQEVEMNRCLPRLRALSP